MEISGNSAEKRINYQTLKRYTRGPKRIWEKRKVRELGQG